MPAPAAPIRQRASRPAARGRVATPILARQLRNGIEESVHRGDIVETDAAGRILRQLGDPDRVVTLRSTVKPFGAVALVEAGGIEAFDLEPDPSWPSSPARIRARTSTSGRSRRSTAGRA